MLLDGLVPAPGWLNSGDTGWQLTAATLVGIQSVPGLAILYAGLMKRKWALNSALMVLYAFAMTLLVWRYGLIGAPLGIAIGACLISLPANFSALAGETEMTFWQMIKPLAPWFARFVVLALCTGASARMWTPNTLALLAATAMITGLIYSAVMFPLVLRDPLGIYIRLRLFPIGTRFFRALRVIGPA